MTGPVMMYWQINPEDFIKGDRENAAKLWDQAIERADGDFSKLMHNICCNNCHHHVVRALGYMGHNYNMITILFNVLTKGKWVSVGRCLQTYCGCIILIGIVLFATYFGRK
eukprot:TRINITY_DN6112_c0_g1_i2.p2 TRINITY_DN6112_c0_g1~~TRINITY_DN6112_c0_g1_i2.p2  ORF type:complete len:111 (+),score=29.79 TRINITY_DN6112_c0_g1_i2:324-656(+)